MIPDTDFLTFIPLETLTVLEPKVDVAFRHPHKKSRQAAFRSLVRVLKQLELSPSNWEVKGLAYGTLGATGERGLFIAYQIHAQVRNLSGNYAKERAK